MSAAPLPRAILDEGSLTVAMAVAPNVYARNRMFAFYKDPIVQRAKARAATIRGAIRQLASERLGVADVRLTRTPSGGAVLRYRLETLRADRTIELTQVEAACVCYLAGRAGAAGLVPTEEDRRTVHLALEKLAVGLPLS